MEQNELYAEHPEQFSLCLKVRAQLQHYLEGYLDVVEAETVRAHLAVCVLCHREYVELEQTIRLVRTLPYLQPARDFAPTIMQAIGVNRRSGWWSWGGRRRPRS